MSEEADQDGQPVQMSVGVARWSGAFGMPAVAVQLRRPMVLVQPNARRTGFTSVDPRTEEQARILHPEPVTAEGGLVATDILTPCTITPGPGGVSLIVHLPVFTEDGQLDYRATLILSPDDILGITLLVDAGAPRIVLPKA